MSILDDFVKNAINDYAKYIVPIVAIGFATAVIINFIRKKITTFKPNLENNKYYREIVLPLAPFILSILISWLIKETIITGVVAGAASGTVYQMIKGYLKRLERESSEENQNS